MNTSPLIAAMIDAARVAGAGLVADQARLLSLNVQSKLGPADMFSEADLRAGARYRGRGFGQIHPAALRGQAGGA